MEAIQETVSKPRKLRGVKLGRKPLSVDKKRVRIGCRVKPSTKKYLDNLDPTSIGRAIDYVVERVIQARLLNQG